jgi:pimeloyl-ACP methyl ester carboxylesterase
MRSVVHSCGGVTEVELDRAVDWRGRRVAWGRRGTGPPVVFCHGTPWSAALWAPFADALSSDFTVHLWDMPGYGRSSQHAEHPVDLGVQGELLRDLLAEWGLDRPHVVAHDIGGAVALRAHLLHGAAYRSLMLVDVVALAPVGSPFFRFVQQHPGVLGELPASIHEAVVREYVQGAGHHVLRPEVVRDLVAPWTGEQGQPAFYRQIEQTDERFLAEFEPLLAGIDIPVRIVWGRQDTWIPPATGQRLHAKIPTSSLRLIDGAGHLVQHDAPVALADELRSWLTAR